MINYWVISPYDSKNDRLYEKVWHFCLNHKSISIGHTVPVDLSGLAEDEVLEIINKFYRNTTDAWLTRKFNMLWQFYNEIKVDDLIIARKGLSVISGVGTVKRSAYFKYEMNKLAVEEDIAFHHHLDVDWQNSPRNLRVVSSGFARGAFLQQISYSKYLSLIPKSYL